MGGWVLQYLVYRDRVLRLCCWVLGDGLQDCAIWGNQSNWSRLYTSVHTLKYQKKVPILLFFLANFAPPIL